MRSEGAGPSDGRAIERIGIVELGFRDSVPPAPLDSAKSDLRCQRDKYTSLSPKLELPIDLTVSRATQIPPGARRSGGYRRRAPSPSIMNDLCATRAGACADVVHDLAVVDDADDAVAKAGSRQLHRGPRRVLAATRTGLRRDGRGAGGTPVSVHFSPPSRALLALPTRHHTQTDAFGCARSAAFA